MPEASSAAVEQCLRAPGQKLTSGEPTRVTVHISSSTGWAPSQLWELWECRELLYFLAWRDVRVRYQQTILGPAWALLKPLLLVFVFSVVFGWLVQVPSEGTPYPLFSLCGVVPWQLFAQTLTAASQSLVANQNLLTKVYFPRLVIPLSTMIGGLADVVVAMGALLGLMVYFHIIPTPYAWTIPFFIVLACATSLGVGLWLSALNVRYRDVGHALPFLIQLWFFATPIAYPSSLVPEAWRNWYAMNPMVSVVEGFRWCLLGTDGLSMTMLLISVVISVSVLGSGLLYFKRVEEHFTDVV